MGKTQTIAKTQNLKFLFPSILLFVLQDSYVCIFKIHHIFKFRSLLIQNNTCFLQKQNRQVKNHLYSTTQNLLIFQNFEKLCNYLCILYFYLYCARSVHLFYKNQMSKRETINHLKLKPQLTTVCSNFLLQSVDFSIFKQMFIFESVTGTQYLLQIRTHIANFITCFPDGTRYMFYNFIFNVWVEFHWKDTLLFI